MQAKAKINFKENEIMTKWEQFSEQELYDMVQNSTSYAQVAQQIGYQGGSGTARVKDMIEHYGFDISHFKGQGWNKDNFDYSRFRYGNNIKSAKALDAIIALRGRKCERCQNE